MSYVEAMKRAREVASDVFREARSFFDANPRCMKCHDAPSIIVRSIGGRRMAVCRGCSEGAEYPEHRAMGISTSAGPAFRRATAPMEGMRRRQRAAEVALPRYAPPGARSATISDSELARILRSVARELDCPGCADVWKSIAEAGVNPDDFRWMIHQLGTELA